MSSFSENFQRDENKDNTQYDDSAFYTYAISFLFVLIVINIILILRRFFYKKKFTDSKYLNCNCEFCHSRLKTINQKISNENINLTFYFYIIILFALLYLSYLCYFQVKKNSGKIKSFNPYEILEIDEKADERTIKKAYKKLALKFHPDKNPNNLQAKAKFILIAKAYEALTNEESKKNFEKYGNPDGPGSMRLSVALPSFILDKKNHLTILVIFLIFILIIVPQVFLFWYNSTKEYNDIGIKKNDEQVFYFELNENILLKQMPYVLGLAFEYRDLPIRQEEANILYETYNKYYKQNLMCKHKLEHIHPSNKKAICLLYSYIMKQPLKYEKYYEELNQILLPTGNFIEQMYKIAISFTQIHMFNQSGNKLIKNFGYNCIKTIFEFSQNLHQQISHFNNPDSGFLQLPYFNENKLKNLMRVLKKYNSKIFNNNKNNFKEFINLPMEERNKILNENGFGNEEILNINYALDALPKYKINLEIFTEGFEDIVENDMITYKFTVIRENLPENKKLGVNHSNNYPLLFEEKIIIFILDDKKKILFNEVITIENRENTFNKQFPCEREGNFKYICEMMSLNYKGLDQSFEFEFEVKKNSDKRKEQLKQIKSREVKKIEATYFQKLLNQVVGINAEDDEEEEEEKEDEEDNEKTKTEEKKKDEKNNDESEKKEEEHEKKD